MGDARKRMEATVEVVEGNGLEIRPEMTELTERSQGEEGRAENGEFSSSRIRRRGLRAADGGLGKTQPDKKTNENSV